MTKGTLIKILLVYGVIGVLVGSYFLGNESTAGISSDYSQYLAFTPAESPNTEPHSKVYQGHPLEIHIPKTGVTLPISGGVYDYSMKDWSISNSSAHFATLTALPNNQQGNTLIYAHNRKGLFGSLDKLEAQDLVYVKTDNNLIFEYLFDSSELVRPDDLSILEYIGQPRLALVTCDGSWDQNRRLVYFSLNRVIKK